MNSYSLEHILTYTGTLASPPEAIGPLPEGVRVNFYSTGGEFEGPGWNGRPIRGRLRPVGGDWMTVRSDGVGLLDVRSTFETADGALILVVYQGTADLGADGYDRFLRGELPDVVELRTAPRFFTGHPDYQWLNRLHCLGIGEYDRASNRARYDVYAVR
jgi:hypothetical protein